MNLADPAFETLRRATRPGDVSVGARHAALLLHAMERSDREWALQALPAAQRATLVGLLDELTSLGIARDPMLVAEAIAVRPSEAATPFVAAESLSAEDGLLALDPSQLEQLVRIMRSEPPRLVAQWLRVRAWPWESALLKGLPPDQRAAVTAILSATAPTATAPVLRRVLVAAVVARMGVQPQGAPIPDMRARTSWHQAVVSAVRRSIRHRMTGRGVER